MNETDLIELKETVETAKEEKMELKGAHKALIDQAKEKWDCATIEKMEAKKSTLEKRYTKLDNQLITGLKELEEAMEEEDEN